MRKISPCQLFLVLANRELLTPNSPFFLVNEMAGPKVSFIQRLRCMLPDARRNPPLEDDNIWDNNYIKFCS